MTRSPARKSRKLEKKRRRGFSWKLLSKKKKSQKKIIQAVSLIGILLASVLFLISLGFYKSISTSFASAQSATSDDLESRELVTVAFVQVEDLDNKPLKTNRISLLVYDKAKDMLIVYKVPIDLELDVPGKFGKEMYSKILALGMMENDNFEDGILLVRRSLEKTFGYKVDRYLLVDSGLSKSFEELVTDGSSLITYDNIMKMISSFKTDMRLGEFYAFYTSVSFLTKDRFVLREEGKEYYSMRNFVDEEIRNLTFDSKVAVENKSLAVLNGTGRPGVASFGARVLGNLGGRVVAIENAGKLYEDSILIVDDKQSHTVQEIVRFFGFNRIKEKNEVYGFTENEVDRVDITLIIGFDIANRL